MKTIALTIGDPGVEPRPFTAGAATASDVIRMHRGEALPAAREKLAGAA